MKKKNPLVFLITALISVSFVLPVRADQPHMHTAKGHLDKAMTFLRRATADKGGHRERAFTPGRRRRSSDPSRADSSQRPISISKCFRSEWLQGERAVNLTISGNTVSGTFIVSGGDEPDKEYKFDGTRQRNTLTVVFAGNQLPDVAPSEMKSLIWTLMPGGEKEFLRIMFSGKNYDTNKYQTTFSYFESCDPKYAAFAKTAQTIHFAKGANSGTVGLESLAEFQAMNAPATFLISAVKGQVLEIRADGCSIQIYLPEKKLFKYVDSVTEGGLKFMGSTKPDRMSTEELQQTGTYLVVLRKAAENMRPKKVTFKVTD